MRLLVLGLVTCFAGSAYAQVELKNDAHTFDDGASFQGGFVIGDQAASRFVPSGTPPLQVQRVRFLFGGSAASQTITLRVHEDDGGAAAPGRQVFSGDFVVSGADATYQEIDLVAEAVWVSGPFRVAIEVRHDGLPGLAIDQDGTIAPDRNFIRSGDWFEASVLGVPGDWILRTDVMGSASPPDAGMDAGADAGFGPAPDADVADAGVLDAGLSDAHTADAHTADASTMDAGPLHDAEVMTDASFDSAASDAGTETASGSGGCSVARRGLAHRWTARPSSLTLFGLTLLLTHRRRQAR